MNRRNCNLVAIFLLMIACFCGAILTSGYVLADGDSVVDQINITVAESCTLAGVGMDSHVATLHNAEYSGQSGSDYVNGIGKTTLTAFCNDYNGFSIYAIGFTGDSYTGVNHTKLVGATNNNNTISTGLYISGDTTSSWAMKVDKITDGAVSYNPTNMSIQNNFDSWHVVPDTYTKIAEYHANSGSSATDTVLGGKLETTYQAYVSASQAADTYEGKVKYTLVHPYDGELLQPQAATSGCVNYFPNGSNVVGTMGCQVIGSSDTSIKLFASNFSRDGYGFAGWSDVFDYTTNSNAHFYGPNEDITFNAGQYTGSNHGLSLYAVWIRSAGDFQDSSDVTTVCNNLTIASVNGARTLASISALTDTRDNQTYAIAKLADGNCWMIENLRLADTHQEGSDTVVTLLTTSDTNNPLNDGTNVTLKHNYTDLNTFNSLSASSNVAYDAGTAPDGWCTNDSVACDDQSRLRTDNTVNRVSFTQNDGMPLGVDNLYTYGNYYNWYSATAGRGTYGFSPNNNSTAGDLCPANWRLPKGGNKTRIESNDDNEFWNLVVDGLNGGINPANYTSSRFPAYDGLIEAIPVSALMRTWPNNFIYSGYVRGATIYESGSLGSYWSSTTSAPIDAYGLYLDRTTVAPGSYNSPKYTGRAIRCLASRSV